MKGFEAWVAGPWSTLALVWGALAVGTVLGWGLARRPRGLSRGERRELADRAADRAARQFRRLREPAGYVEALAATRAGRAYWSPREVHHERRTSTASFLAPKEEAIALVSRFLDPTAARMAWEDNAPWSEHVDQALDVANGDPITTGEIRAITEDMDVWLERTLEQHPVPYPDGSGQ